MSDYSYADLMNPVAAKDVEKAAAPGAASGDAGPNVSLPPASKAPAMPDAGGAATPQPAAPQPAAPSPYDNFMPPASQQQSMPQASAPPAEPTGAHPGDALDYSPLGIVDRARFGWAKTPAAQQNMLEDKFGKGNVQLVRQGDEAGFVTKVADKWYQVDPSFAWNMKGLGGLTGSVAQFAGQSGTKALAAGAGGVMGAEAGAVGGPWGMAIGGVVGAGMGAMGTDATEMAGRYGLSKLGMDDPSSLPKNADDVAKQLAGSFLFGAEGELGGKLIGGTVSASAKALAAGVQRLTATPAGKQMAAKILSLVSGQSENLMRIRANDPLAMVNYDTVASQDAENQTSNLAGMMKKKVEDFTTSARGALRGLGRQYNDVDAAARTVDYQPYSAGSNTTAQLMDAGYLKGGKIVDYTTDKGLSIDLTGNDRSVLNYVKSQAENINNGALKGDKFSYDDVRGVIRTLDSKLYSQGDNAISDNNVRRIVTQFKSDLGDHVDATMPKQALTMKQQLDTKYGPAKDFVESLENKNNGQQMDTFVKQVIKQDGSFNANLMQSVRDLLPNVEDPTQDILRMHVAKESTALWGKGRGIMGAIPASPAAAASLATNFSATKSNAGQLASGIAQTVPYMDQALSLVKKLNPGDRLRVLQNPDSLSLIWKTAVQAASSEKDTSEQLLQQAGVSGPKQ
jgi:hypothetical protein